MHISMRKIWNTFYTEDKRIVLGLCVILFVVSLLELFGLVLVIPYVNLMLNPDYVAGYLERYPVLEHMIDFSADYQLVLSLWFSSYYLVKNLLLTIFSYIEQTLLKKVKVNVMDRMYTYYMRQPYSYHLQVNSSKLVRSITYDAIAFIDTVLKSGALLISEILLFIGVLIVLIWKNPIALWVFIFIIVPVAAIYMLIKKRLVLWAEIMQQRESDNIRFLQEGLGGIKDAIILGVQSYFENSFHNNVMRQTYIKRNRDVAVLVPRFVIETLMMVSLAGALLWMAQSGGLMQNISAIAFLAVASVRILPMSNRVLGSISTIRSAIPSIDVVHNIANPGVKLDIKPPVRIDKTDPFHKLAVNSLSFCYNAETINLKNVNFDINKGETIGIVGGSGAGKTTLVDVLLGLLKPTEGDVTCNGESIYTAVQQWQSKIGYVQQVIFLMDASIKENVAYGIPAEEIDIDRVMEVVQLTKLDYWINELADGIETHVGERGIRISGGQRQRIGLARALYHDPELLVLDEATSALDNLTEKEIMDDIYAMQGDRTIIMIAHRLDTIRRCDRVFVFEAGKLVGEGQFDELSANNKEFQRIGAMK